VCGLCKIYYAKFRNTDGTPIREFIPVRRLSDGAVGLWDKVTEEFYGNAGTGEFIAHEMEETT
jgi:UDP-glucose 4-epimerase